MDIGGREYAPQVRTMVCVYGVDLSSKYKPGFTEQKHGHGQHHSAYQICHEIASQVMVANDQTWSAEKKNVLTLVGSGCSGSLVLSEAKLDVGCW